MGEIAMSNTIGVAGAGTTTAQARAKLAAAGATILNESRDYTCYCGRSTCKPGTFTLFKVRYADGSIGLENGPVTGRLR